MFLVFALIATLPLLAMSYLALNATRDALKSEVGRANGDAAEAAAGFVDVYVENARVLLGAEARGPVLRDALTEGDRAAMMVAVQGLRERATYQDEHLFRGVALFDANGTLLAAYPAEAAEQMTDQLHVAALEVALQQREPLFFPAPRTGEPVLPMATPVLDNTTMRGVLMGDLSLAALGEGLAPFAAGRQTVFLTDARGTVLVHPDPEVLATRPDWSEIGPVVRAQGGPSERNFVEYDDPLTGERSLGSYATIPRLGWIVVDSVPTSVAYGALQQLTGVLIALSGLLVGAILLASVAVARRIVAPVQELTAASRELAEGKLGRRVKPEGNDEISELGRAFDQMADRIAESLEGLRRSESRYRSLVESASDLIFTVQPDGELSFASPMMRRVLGAHVHSGSVAVELVHPDDRAAFREAVQRVVQHGEPALWIPFRMLGENGTTRAVLTNFTPIYDAGDQPARVLAVAHDVTEERRQEDLREKAFQMARLVSEETGLDALAHRGLLLMLGSTQLPRGVVFLSRGGELRAVATQALREPSTYLELAARARTSAQAASGYVGSDAALAAPLLEHGEVLGVVVLAGEPRAIEASQAVVVPLASQLAVGLRRSLFEARLKEYAAELESRVAERTRELTQKSEEMEQFLYSVSHDLKAPLISIQGYAQGLEEDYARQLEGEGAQYLDRIRKNATLMESLILDILELSRIGRTKEQVEEIDMARLIGDVASRVADRFAAAGGELRVDAPLPGVQAEPKRLGQLFSNLVDNAIKYRHPQRPPRVRIWGEAKGERVTYHVEDNGRGIPERYHDQVFKIFQRVPTPGMEDPGGTGMGLAIVKRIAETQGGRIWFDSVEDKGTTFHLELPRKRKVE
jgi:PAS domain S-box-containing protein